jgi:glyoxylase-like metal-dependent hydrolase (beta-lactamase superfamily II)
MICHCLLIEADDGLVLIDTGFGTDDVRDPKRLGFPARITAARPQMEETALAQVEALGFTAADVRHIVVTHLDFDHAGGLPDFPDAEVHVFAPELRAALEPSFRDRPRYSAAQWRHGPRWVEHSVEGDEWLGFEGVRILPGVDAEVLLVPVPGHTVGHTAVAIREDDRWLLHAGDAYFHHGEVEATSSCPPLLTVFQFLTARDGRTRRENRERLRELAASHGDEVRLICSHDPVDLEREQARADAPATVG